MKRITYLILINSISTSKIAAIAPCYLFLQHLLNKSISCTNIPPNELTIRFRVALPASTFTKFTRHSWEACNFNFKATIQRSYYLEARHRYRTMQRSTQFVGSSQTLTFNILRTVRSRNLIYLPHLSLSLRLSLNISKTRSTCDPDSFPTHYQSRRLGGSGAEPGA